MFEDKLADTYNKTNPDEILSADRLFGPDQVLEKSIEQTKLKKEQEQKLVKALIGGGGFDSWDSETKARALNTIQQGGGRQVLDPTNLIKSSFFTKLNEAEEQEEAEQIKKGIPSRSDLYANDLSRAAQLYSENKELRDAFDIESLKTLSNEEKYQLLKKGQHDLAHFESTEQRLADILRERWYAQIEDANISPDEALQEARKYGVELKFDKPVTKSELNYSIQRQLLKKDLEVQVANYRQTGEYSALQKLLLTCSAISGAVGFWELAGILGTSYLLGVGVAAGIGTAAKAIGTGSRVFKAISLAQKIQAAQKYAKTATSIASTMEDTLQATHYITKAGNTLAALQEELKASDLATKIAYDSYRAGKLMQGTRGSLMGTSAYLTMDGIVTEALPQLIKYYGDKANNTEEYTGKDILAGLFLAGAFGAGAAVAGAGIKKIPSALWDMYETTSNRIAKETNEKVMEAAAKGYEGFAEEMAKRGKTLSDADEALFKAMRENRPVSEIQAAVGEAIAHDNLTDEEFTLLFTTVLKTLKEGKSTNFILDSLPFRNRYYSNLKSMLDCMDNFAKDSTLTYEDFMKQWTELGATFTHSRPINKTMSSLQDIISCLEAGELPIIGVKITEEGGALGRDFVYGITKEEAYKNLFNIYLSRMKDETERGIQAGLSMEDDIARMQLIKQKIDRIVDTYERIASENTAAKEAGRPIVYSYSKGEQNIYQTDVGNNSSIFEALVDLAFEFLPKEKQQAYIEATKFMEEVNNNMATTGKAIGNNKQLDNFLAEQAMHQQNMQEIKQYLKAFADAIGTEEEKKSGVYFNLRHIGKDATEDTSFLKKLSSDLDDMIHKNSDLYNTDRIFQQGINPEALLNKIQGIEDIPFINFSREAAPITAVEFKELVKNNQEVFDRLALAQAELDKYMGSKTQASFKEITDLIESSTEKDRYSRNVAKAFYLDLENGIENCITILNTNFTDFKNTLMSKLQDKQFFREGLPLAANLKQIIKEEEEIFREGIKDTILDLVGEKELLGKFGKELQEKIDIAIDDFVGKISKDKESIAKATGKHTFNLQEDAVEDIAKAVKDEAEQQAMFDEVLKSFANDLASCVANHEASLLHVQKCKYDLWERCLATPGKMSETILGDVTMTYLPTKGASTSIENLSNVLAEHTLFLQSLDKLDTHEAGELSLREWAFDKKNFETIREAIVMRHALLNDLLTEEEKLAIKENSREGRVAMAFFDSFAGMQQKLHNIGSNKRNLVSFIDNAKLVNADSFCRADALNGALANNIRLLQQANILSSEAVELLSAFLPASNKKVDMRVANFNLYKLEHLDLDKQFRYRKKVKLNDIRDALLDKNIASPQSSLNQLITKYGKDKILEGIRALKDNMLGVPDQSLSLLDRCKLGSKSPSNMLVNHASKYLDDLDARFHYKSLDSLKLDMEYFGHDDLDKWILSDLTAAKKAYAVLTKAGSEPYQYYKSMEAAARIYADKIAPVKYGVKNAKLLQESIFSDTFTSRLDFAINQVCGTYSTPISAGARFVKALGKILSAPMLAKAGWKSLTDYNNIYQYLVTMGLYSSVDVKGGLNVAQKMMRVFMGDRNLTQLAYIQQHLKGDILQEIIYNGTGFTPIATEGIDTFWKGLFNMFKGDKTLNSMASPLLKFERFARWFSDMSLNKVAWIGPLTDFNRSNAALCLGQALGDFASTSFDKMPKRLQDSLLRYNITGWEWDNIYSKKAVMNMNKYIQRTQPTIKDSILHDFNYFATDLLADLTDEEITKFIIEKSIAENRDVPTHISKLMIDRYRNVLIDKAAMLVNTSADEMISIPTARIQGALNMGQDPNSWMGIFISNLLQFQSFGASVNFYQHARRFATHFDKDDQLFNKLLLCSSGFGPTATDMMGLVANMAFWQYTITELVQYASGTRKKNTDLAGAVNWEVVADKGLQSIFDSLGFIGMLIDGLYNGFMKPRGKGGGIIFSVLPAMSSVDSSLGKVKDAATRESTKYQRGKAIGASITNNMIIPYATGGMNNTPYMHAAYQHFIGEWLQEMEMGTGYYPYKERRRKQGFEDSWFTKMIESKENNNGVDTADFIEDDF